MREAIRELNEQKAIVEVLQNEMETLKKQNNQLIEDNAMLDKAISDAVKVGYEKARQDFNDYLDKTMQKYGMKTALLPSATALRPLLRKEKLS